MALRVTEGSGARFLAFARLVRPLNLLAIGLAAGVGSRLAGGPLRESTIFVPILIGAFGYARNDALDLAADRLNRPDRPVPSGAVSPRAAAVVAWCALAGAAAWLVARPHPPGAWGIAVVAALALYLYSPWLKDRGAAGPLAISALSFLTVLWGASDAGEPGLTPLVPLCGLLAAAAQFARECVKQLEDAAGDREAERGTWAIRAGAPSVTRAASLALVAALLLLPLPATAGGAAPIYLRVAIPGAGLPLLVALVALGTKAPDHAFLSRLIKVALFGGLLAFAGAV